MNPTKDGLLVRVQAEKTKKGETIKSDAVMRAEVLKTGPKATIKKGEYVVFAPYGIDEVSVQGPRPGTREKLLIVSEELIIATYEPERKGNNPKVKG